jgi:putative ATP-binding cassette transporter
MQLVHFLSKETKAPLLLVATMAGVSGIMNGLILMLINIAADNVDDKITTLFLLIGLIAVFIIYIVTLRFALIHALTAVGDALEKIKIRISNKVRQTGLRFIEENKGIGMYSALIQDTNMISEGVVQSVYSLQSSLMLLIIGLYLAAISPMTFFAVLTLIALAMPIYTKEFHKATEEMQASAQKEGEFLGYFNAILQGFKELKLNQRENDELYGQLRLVSDEMQAIATKSNLSFIFNMIFSSSILYVVLLVTVFIVPTYTPTHSDVIHSITSTIIFIMGPLIMLATGIPVFAKTTDSIERLYTLEKKLDAANLAAAHEAKDYPAFTEFQTLAMQNVLFHYRDSTGQSLFTSGPHSFTLQQGELLFIVGGNGSGKSTFLKLLTGLYHPEEGELYLDGEIIDAMQYPAYRELFSIVFTDFHLFDQIYGLPDLKESDVIHWLKEMQLEKKTRFHNHRFTNMNLSTGQKKRLAFIVAVLRNRPICIFDELAADQDPQFRHHFYEKILPALKAQGRTVIVVSHDDQYFHCADRVLKLDEGKIQSFDDANY